MTVRSSSAEKKPPREDAMPQSYAIFVEEEQIRVWQYRASVAEPQGEWRVLETLNQESNPRLDLEFAELCEPDENGYWIYSTSYDCSLDCD